MASAQVCGGVHRNTIRNSTSGDPGERAGHRGPADQRREAAGDPAPDDVLRGTPLEPPCTRRCRRRWRQREAGGQPVHEGARATAWRPPQGPGRRGSPPRSTECRGSGRRRVRRIRSSMSRSSTQLKALALAAARQPPTIVNSTSHSGGTPAGGEEHRRHGGDQQQLDDPRLGQPDVSGRDVPDPATRCREGRRRPGRHDHRPATRPGTSMLVTGSTLTSARITYGRV